MGCYAVIPDGQDGPAALFVELEDAMDWALATYGDDGFGIRYIEVARIDKADRAAGPRPLAS